MTRAGTGKTLVAFHIIWRFLEARKENKNTRVLFLADRDVLVGQPMRDDFAPFGNKMHRLDKHIMDTTHEVYLSLYHQLKNGEVNYYTAYDRDFFDLVIVDDDRVIIRTKLGKARKIKGFALI